MRVTADDNLIDQVATFVSGDTLYVASEGKLRPKVELVVRISAPNLQGISAADAGALRARGLRAERFELDLEGDTAAILEGEGRDPRAQGQRLTDHRRQRPARPRRLADPVRQAPRGPPSHRPAARDRQRRPGPLPDSPRPARRAHHWRHLRGLHVPPGLPAPGHDRPSPARKGRGKQEEDDPLAAYRDPPPQKTQQTQQTQKKEEGASSGQGLDAFGDEPPPEPSQPTQDEPEQEDEEGGLSPDAFGDEEGATDSPGAEDPEEEQGGGGFSPDDFDG